MILQFPSPPSARETRVCFRRRETGAFCVIATITDIDDDAYVLSAREFCGAVCNPAPRRLRVTLDAANDGETLIAAMLSSLIVIPPFYLHSLHAVP